MKKLFALMDQSRIVYTICIYKGHLFRLYRDGHITGADEADRDAARTLKHIR